MVTKEPTEVKTEWCKRFRAPSIMFSRIAKNAPERGMVISNQVGPYQIYAWNVLKGNLYKRTDYPEGKTAADISMDGRYIYYLDDELGNERGHFVRIPFFGGEPEDITPDLAPYSPGLSYSETLGLSFSGSGNRVAFTAGAEDGFRVYVIDLAPDGTFSKAREIYHSEPLISAPLLSSDGEVVVVASTKRYKTPQFSLLAFDVESGKQVGELFEGEKHSVIPLFFSPVSGDMRIAMITNRSGIERLLIWNPITGQRLDPNLDEFGGAIHAFDWSEDGKKILFRTFNRAVQQLCIYEVETDTGYQLSHPPGTSYSPYFSPEGNIYAHWDTVTCPMRLAVMNVETGAIIGSMLEAGKVPPGKPWSNFEFLSSDGTEIHGWIAVPDGEGPYPLVLDTHGGPQAVMPQMFLPEAQAWLDHGFAWASINYRGSTTFGKAFEEQIWGNPGEWEVEDMVAARDFLVVEGIADPEKIFLTGWSYGGYLTLQALGKYPDLWAGGIAGVAITDWRTSYEDANKNMKQYCVSLFGGTPEEKPEQYARSSPISYAEKVNAPVLIIQGRYDTWTPARQLNLYYRRMKALDKKIQVHWFDAGHTGPFAVVDQAMKNQELMLKFALETLESSDTVQDCLEE